MDDVEEAKRALEDALGEWFKIEETSHSEAIFLLELLNRYSPNQTFRRAFIRSSWAQIEGVCYCLKEIASAAMNLPDAPFIKLPHEKNDGAIERVKLSIKAGATVLSPKFKPNFGSSGWNSLRSSLDVRHALVHPKTADDLHVSNDNISHAKQGFEWFIETTRDISQAASNRLS